MHGYGNSHAGKVPDGRRIPLRQCPGKAGTRPKVGGAYPEDYTVNVEALERVQPKDLTASEIAVRLGATWLPTEIVEQFMFEFLGTPRYAQWNIKVHFSAYTGEWNIEGKSYDRSNVKAYSTYGTGRINAYKIIEETLNLKDVRIFDYVEDADGKKESRPEQKWKRQSHRQSRSLSSRAFRIGSGLTLSAENGSAAFTTINSTACVPVSTMEATSFSVV